MTREEFLIIENFWREKIYDENNGLSFRRILVSDGLIDLHSVPDDVFGEKKLYEMYKKFDEYEFCIAIYLHGELIENAFDVYAIKKIVKEMIDDYNEIKNNYNNFKKKNVDFDSSCYGYLRIPQAREIEDILSIPEHEILKV